MKRQDDDFGKEHVLRTGSKPSFVRGMAVTVHIYRGNTPFETHRTALLVRRRCTVWDHDGASKNARVVFVDKYTYMHGRREHVGRLRSVIAPPVRRNRRRLLTSRQVSQRRVSQRHVQGLGVEHCEERTTARVNGAGEGVHTRNMNPKALEFHLGPGGEGKPRRGGSGWSGVARVRRAIGNSGRTEGGTWARDMDVAIVAGG